MNKMRQKFRRMSRKTEVFNFLTRTRSIMFFSNKEVVMWIAVPIYTNITGGRMFTQTSFVATPPASRW